MIPNTVNEVNLKMDQEIYEILKEKGFTVNLEFINEYIISEIERTIEDPCIDDLPKLALKLYKKAMRDLS